MSQPDLWLKRLLTLAGGVVCCALIFVFVPAMWMSDIAVGLTLERPRSTPLFHYLTRSLSAMYAMHGILLLAVSRDVVRYRVLITILAAATVALGAVIFGIDIGAGMPWWWTWGEGPSVMLAGIAMLWLNHLGKQRVDPVARG